MFVMCVSGNVTIINKHDNPKHNTGSWAEVPTTDGMSEEGRLYRYMSFISEAVFSPFSACISGGHFPYGKIRCLKCVVVTAVASHRLAQYNNIHVEDRGHRHDAYMYQLYNHNVENSLNNLFGRKSN